MYYIHVASMNSFDLLMKNSFFHVITDNSIKTVVFPKLHQHIYEYLTSFEDSFATTLIQYSNRALLDVKISDSNDFDTNYQLKDWTFGKMLTTNSTKKLNILLICYNQCDYTLLIYTNKELKINSERVFGYANKEMMINYYYFSDFYSKFVVKLLVFIGNCDLYVKNNDSVSFLDYDFRAIEFESKIFKFPEDRQDFYVGVYCSIESSYILSIIPNNIHNYPLVSGISSIGLIKKAEIEYFNAELEPNDKLSVYLTFIYGSATLNFLECGDICEYFMNEKTKAEILHSKNTPTTEIHVKNNQSTKIVIILSVLAISEVFYEIIPVINNSIQTLRSGSPVFGEISDKNPRFYKFTTNAQDFSELKIVLTNIVGKPTMKSYFEDSVSEYYSFDNGIETGCIQYSGKNVLLEKNYFVEVRSVQVSIFSIAVLAKGMKNETILVLYPQKFQFDNVLNHFSNFYCFFNVLQGVYNFRIQIISNFTGFSMYLTNSFESLKDDIFQ